LNGAGYTFGPAVVNAVFAMLLAALALSFLRLVRGPTMPDRVVALDLVAAVVVAMTALYSIVTEQPVLLDVAIGIALITFLGTVAFAQYIERRARDDQ
jgi:multicomponent Na+:H+ antiporter subunit F